MRSCFFITVLTLFCCGSLRAQPRPLMRDVWMNDNRTAVRARILQHDAHGRIAIGTAQGLYLYNGSTFRLVPGTGTYAVTALTLAKDTLWAGFANGTIGYIGNDSLKPWPMAGYRPGSAISSLLRQADGSLWTGTEQGIFYQKGHTLLHYNTRNSLSDDFIYNFFVTGKRLVAGTDQGINDLDFSGGKMVNTVITASRGLRDNIVRVLRHTGTAGLYWIGSQQGGLSLYYSRERRCTPLHTPEPWRWGQVNDILALPGRRAWVATDAGYLLDVRITQSDSLFVRAFHYPEMQINSLLQDASGNIWCATEKGLSMFTANYLEHIVLPPPYALSEVTAICSGPGSRLYLALDKKLYMLDDARSSLRLLHTARSPVSVLFADHQDNLWIGTSGDGLWRRRAGGAVLKIAAPELTQENILSITVSGDQLWISGLNGVKEFGLRKDGSLSFSHTHNKASGIGSDYVYQLFSDRRNRLWMATDGAGVSLYDKGKYRHWPAFDSSSTKVVYTLTEDAGGAIWAGTLYKDLFRLSGNHWENVRRKEVQDIDVNLSAINTNATGQLVAVYQRCIDVWYPGNRQFRHFNSRHGLGLDSTSRVLNCSARDSAGNVYVPYEKGLLVFPNQQEVSDIRPGIALTGISSNQRKVDQTHSVFGPDENYFSFGYEGISFTNPERLNYRFRLEGYSDNWVYTNDVAANFPRLPSGSYLFRVQVSLNGDFDQARQATFPFVIAAPLWKRGWFIALAFATAFGIIYLLIRRRDRRFQHLAQLEQERIVFGYEHLKSQVNPHFLFNSLNTLANLIEENTANAVTYTERLSDLYRNMLRYHDKELIPLGEEWEILQSYLHIQQSRFGTALQLHGTIDEHLRQTKKIPPMALQLLVENAIKHNIVSMSIPLIITIVADEYEISISNPVRPKLRKELESGIGLTNIRSRYALLTRRKVSFGRQGDHWVVSLPLL